MIMEYTITKTGEMNGVIHYNISFEGGEATGIEIPMPKCDKYLIEVSCKGGFLMCGYLNMGAADKIGNPAALISGARINNTLENPAAAVSAPAAAMGAAAGMTGIELLKLFMKNA